MFLFLSGLLTNLDFTNYRKRLTKVLIPYVIWTVFYVYFNYFMNHYIPTFKGMVADVVASLINGKSAEMMYFIPVYCQLVLLIPLCRRWAVGQYRLLPLLISPLFVLLNFYLPLFTSVNINGTLHAVLDWTCLGWFSYFYLGYLIGNRQIQVKVRKNILLGMVIIGMLFQVAESWWLYLSEIGNCGTQLKYSVYFTNYFLCLLAYLFIVRNKSEMFKALKAIGDNSFGIFFSHIAVIRLLNLIPGYTRIAVFPMNGIIALAVSYSLVQLVKSNVSPKLSKYLGF